MSRVHSSFLTMSNSQSKFRPPSSASLLTFVNLLRYAEIVNVKLGNGETRKGQVLEICGKRAVVQVSLLPVPWWPAKLLSLARLHQAHRRLELKMLIYCSTLFADFRRYRRYRQHSHPLWVHWWCTPHANQYRDAWSSVQWTGYPNWLRSTSPRRRLPWYPGK